MLTENEIEARLAGIDGAGEQLLPPTPRYRRRTPYVTVIEDNTTTAKGNAPYRQLLRRFLTRDSIFQLLGFLWCVPALWVLVVNFQQHIVGPSLRCAKCYSNPLSLNYSREIARLSAKDHDIVGVLQLVAKALELWFLAVAASLIHDLVALRAENGGGIAFGFLTAYLEFKELRYLFSPHLWKSASAGAQRRASAFAGYPLVILVVALAIESAVIGPAMAVLLIPTIQLRETRHAKGPIAQVAAADPPSNLSLANCSSQLLSIGNYSCTESLYSPGLDAILTSAAFSNATQPGALTAPGISQENQVFFQLNVTQKGEDYLVSSPNRFVLREVSTEFNNHYLESINQTASKLDPGLDYAQQTFYHRIGPAITTSGNCRKVNVSVNVLGPGKEIHCYGSGRVFDVDIFENVCVTCGPEWDLGIDRSQFFLGWEDYWDNTWVASVNVTVFQTDQNFYFPWGNQTCPLKQAYDGQWLLEDSCPWSDLLDSRGPSPATFVEYRVPGVTYPNETVLCESQTYLGYRDYVFDGLGLQNDRFDLVTINDLSHSVTEKLIRMHPDWLLAGWSVDRNGKIPGRRASARIVVEAIKQMLDDPLDGNNLYLTLLQQLVLSQAASMIDYRTVPFNGTVDESNPQLDTWRMIEVYSYGFFSSTTKVSAVAVTAGVLFCLGHGVLFVVKGSPGFRSFQDLLVMAFRYRPGPEAEDGGSGGGIRETDVRIVTDMQGHSDFVVRRGDKGKGKDVSAGREDVTAQLGLLGGGDGGDIELQGSSSIP